MANPGGVFDNIEYIGTSSETATTPVSPKTTTPIEANVDYLKASSVTVAVPVLPRAPATTGQHGSQSKKAENEYGLQRKTYGTGRPRRIVVRGKVASE